MFKNILVPTDGSKLSQKAVRQAIALARGAPTKPATGSYAAPPPVPAEGLSPPLAAMLDARRTSGGA